jgi:predicted dehydrogenase
MWSHQVEPGEALKTELDHFIDCIGTGKKPINDGHAGWRVVKMLEAANQSVSKRGELVYL